MRKSAIIFTIFIIGVFLIFTGKVYAEEENVKMKTLIIKWQRLLFEGETCPRCDSTGKEVDKAVSVLSQSLAPLGIEVKLEKTELSVSEFKKNPLQSNRIWIGKRPLEDWVEGKVDKSPCCDVCGPSECRTLEIEGKVYEAIPADVIVQAGLLAAAEIIKKEPINASCCDPKVEKSSKEKPCCPK